MSRKVIDNIFLDGTTGVPVLEDTRGDFHIVTIGQFHALALDERKYLMSHVKSTWPDTENFHRIPDFRNEGQYLDYTVPEGGTFHITMGIVAVSGDDVSILAMYVNDNLAAIAPVRDSLYYAFANPFCFAEGTEISLRFKPYNKKVALGVIVGGHVCYGRDYERV